MLDTRLGRGDVLMTEQPITDQAGDADSNRRESDRVNPYWLHCDPGYVLDISETGIRLLVKRPLRGQMKLPIWTDDIGVHVQTEVVWSRKIGFRQYEVGLRFIDLTELEVSQLRAIAMEHGEKLEQAESAEGVKSDAATSENPAPTGPLTVSRDDASLVSLIKAWPVLPDAVKAGIIAMANAAKDKAA